MSIYNLSDASLEKDWRWLFELVAGFMDVITDYLVATEVNLPCIAKRVGSYLVPYSLAGEIQMLFDYARGNQALSRDYVQATTVKIYRLLSLNVMTHHQDTEDYDGLGNNDIDSDLIDACFEPIITHPIIRVLYAANGRLKLNEGNALTANELFALTGLNAARAKALKLTTQLSASGKTQYLPTDVTEVLKNIG